MSEEVREPVQNSETAPITTEVDWHSHLQNCQTSGLSQAEYCRQHNLKYHSFLYWKRKLYKPVRDSKDIQLVELSGGLNFSSLLPGLPPSSLRVWLGEYCIEVGDNFSPGALSQLVHTLRSL